MKLKAFAGLLIPARKVVAMPPISSVNNAAHRHKINRNTISIKQLVIVALLNFFAVTSALATPTTQSYKFDTSTHLAIGQHVRVDVDFGTAFSSLDNLMVLLSFGTDGWDGNETWYSPQLGGQGNGSNTTRYSAQANVPHQSVLSRFLDGEELIDLYAEGGSFDLTSATFVITGTPVSRSIPEPNPVSLLALGIAAIASFRRQREQ